MKNNKKLNLLLALFIFGTLVSLYLVYLHFQPSASEVCQINELFNCDKVNKSIYAKLFGIPVSILGLLYNIFACFVILYLKKDFNLKIFKGLFVLNTFGLLFALYLSYVELFVLYAICLFCVIHQIDIILSTIVFYLIYKENKISKISID
jgi:uncharacterized membrane protein